MYEALSLKILSDTFAGHVQEETPFWCQAMSMEDYGRSKHDKIRDKLLQLMRYDPAIWSREGNKVVIRLNDARKLRRDIPDWLLTSGSSGNNLVFDARELQEFLGELPFERKNRRGLFARLFPNRK